MVFVNFHGFWISVPEDLVDLQAQAKNTLKRFFDLEQKSWNVFYFINEPEVICSSVFSDSSDLQQLPV